MRCCSCKQSQFQPYPVRGIKTNLSLSEIKKSIENEPHATIYCYIVKSIKRNKDGTFQQMGCAPNWQGGLITLCTCKHFMRTFKTTEEWKGQWVAGFTSINFGFEKRGNGLVYLMKVEKAYKSHFDLWRALPPKIRTAKDACKSSFGDIYSSKKGLSIEDRHKYRPSIYNKPCSSHVHFKGWRNDINYKANNRPAALLVGDKTRSFLWDKPFIAANAQISRGQKKMCLSEFLKFIFKAKQ
jgi:hypothetical protein